MADGEVARLGLNFPFLQNEDGSQRPLQLIDFEHSLCYFSRYLGIKEHLGGKPNEERLCLAVQACHDAGIVHRDG